jgi:lysophospholipase L1-like esterase
MLGFVPQPNLLYIVVIIFTDLLKEHFMLARRFLFIYISSFCFLISCSTAQSKQKLQEISADNKSFQYIGRVDFTNRQAPAFGYPATGIKFKFQGKTLKLKLSDDRWGDFNYLGVYIDGNPKPVIIYLKNGEKESVYEVSDKLENKIHSVLLVKRTDYISGEFKFHGAIIDAGKKLLPPEPAPTRKIEIYGDSISAGGGVEYPLVGKKDPENNDCKTCTNAYLSFGAMLARNYHADLHLIAQGGISLIDGYGYWNDKTGMESVYDKVKPLKDAQKWDFNSYIPDLVIIALGQNDSSTITLNNKITSEDWKNHYKNFILNIRKKYPKAHIICMFTNMYHDTKWDTYITQAVGEYSAKYKDKKVYSLITKAVTPGHPREIEQKAMSDSLKDLIDNTLSKNGFKW